MLTSVSGSDWDAWQEVIGRDDVDALEVLRTAAMYERYFQEVQNHAARVARAEGRTWQELADAVGTTKQTAWQKWRSPKERTRIAEFRFATLRVGDRIEERRQQAEPLVESVVDSCCGRDDPMRPELLKVARDALEYAVTSYNEQAGRTSGGRAPFAVYATWVMRQAVTRRRNKLRAQ
jgi:hypothetical protein